jgi:hypothetical protein
MTTSRHGWFAALIGLHRLKLAYARESRGDNTLQYISGIRPKRRCWPSAQPANWIKFLSAPESPWRQTTSGDHALVCASTDEPFGTGGSNNQAVIDTMRNTGAARVLANVLPVICRESGF